MDNWIELEGKAVHDVETAVNGPSVKPELVPGAIIVGAGPSGLAVAACLKKKGVPSFIIERSSCIASLWQHKAYDRLSLHLPKQYCELPFMAYPDHFPTYPNKQQFISYLQEYAEKFKLGPSFNEVVERAEYDQSLRLWRVNTTRYFEEGQLVEKRKEYLGRWLVAATGENSDGVMPKIEGIEEFGGEVLHTNCYKSGEGFNGKRVLVVGCGNSGMDVCLDLCNSNVLPSLVVRNCVHILPRDMWGTSTFGLAMLLLKWLPIKLVDQFILLMSRIILGDTASFGFPRPSLGPFQLKFTRGKSPVLDVGSWAKIRAGEIKVFPGIKRFAESNKVEFVDGRQEIFDALIMATGYKSNVPSWLMEDDFFSKEDGFPRSSFPDKWKGKDGLYAVGFTRKGLFGASMDAKKISEDIEKSWRV